MSGMSRASPSGVFECVTWRMRLSKSMSSHRSPKISLRLRVLMGDFERRRGESAFDL